MNRLTIITDKDELRELLGDLLKDITTKQASAPPAAKESDIVDIQGLAEYLTETGIKTTRKYIQQLVLNRQIPYMEFDSRLLFSKKEIMATITANKVMPRSEKETLNDLVHRMRKRDDDAFF